MCWFKGTPQPTPGDKAVLIGINDYPDSPLEGCVNDVNDVAEMLCSSFGFKEENIRILTDKRATTGAILERLEWLANSEPGARLYHHYSGHGTQYAARAGSGEVDGLMEVICPVDFDWTSQNMITDKDYVKIFSKIPQGCLFNWCSDSCHSGDLDRNPSKKRYLKPPQDILWRIKAANSKGIKRALINGTLDVGFMSGCESTQTSADAFIDGRSCGAFTYCFIKILKKNPKLNLNEIRDMVLRELQMRGFDQRPTVSGARQRNPFLA